MKWVDLLAIILLIVGGLNWGIIAITGTNIVEALFGHGLPTEIIYGLVGLAAIWIAVQWKQIHHRT